MLPHAYELPAAVVLVLSGAVACFAGYRLFRIVLAVYGFVLGAMIGSSMVGATNATSMIVAAIIGGVLGAVILVFAYFVGIALAGAGLAVLLAHLIWARVETADPPAVAVIVVSIVGAIAAMVMQRYVIVLSTAFGGAWTLLVGLLTAAGGRFASRPGSAPGAWILYPLDIARGERWVPLAWIALGLLGTLVQLGVTARRR
jgi:hypothetical protein